jgi:hypothetical protein
MAKESKQARTARLNRTRWVKGQSGNPAGRPKSSGTLLKELRIVLNECDPRDKQGRTYVQTIARKMVGLAAAGSIRSTREILDRMHGKPRQSIAVSGSLETTDRQSRVERILAELETLKTDGGSQSIK